MSPQNTPQEVEYDDENNHPAAGTFTTSADEPGITHTPTAADNDMPDIIVTTFHGVTDGKPVLQIDTNGHDVDFRINVNDAPVWDFGTDSGEWDVIHNAAKDHVKTLRSEARIHSGSALEDLLAHIATLEAALGKLA